jgi:hypothetical protein
MNYRLITIAAPAALLVLGWIIFLLLSLDRTRSMPQCWRCGASKIRRSHSHRWLDTFAAFSLLSPFRCRGCRSRFYALRIPRRSLERALP